MKSKALKVALLAIWSALVTVLTFVLGGAVLRGLRVYAGENIYWLAVMLLTGVFAGFGFFTYAAIYFGSALLIGVFSDLEERGFDYFKAGLGAIVILSLLAGGAFAFWLAHQSSGWFDVLVTRIEQPISQLLPADQKLPLAIGDILRQAPSLFVMLFVFSLFFALLLERRILKRLGKEQETERKLLNFKVPDLLIFLLIPSLFAVFGQIKDVTLHTVSLNVFNVCLLLYFFQGMAVLSVFFGRMKMSPFWQIVLTVFLALQLFVFVGLVGVMDYWMDFRKRMKSRPAETNEQIYRNK
jgi:MFS family permease